MKAGDRFVVVADPYGLDGAYAGKTGTVEKLSGRFAICKLDGQRGAAILALESTKRVENSHS